MSLDEFLLFLLIRALFAVSNHALHLLNVALTHSWAWLKFSSSCHLATAEFVKDLPQNEQAAMKIIVKSSRLMSQGQRISLEQTDWL